MLEPAAAVASLLARQNAAMERGWLPHFSRILREVGSLRPVSAFQKSDVIPNTRETRVRNLIYIEPATAVARWGNGWPLKPSPSRLRAVHSDSISTRPSHPPDLAAILLDTP
jgi:hypothetical protein